MAPRVMSVHGGCGPVGRQAGQVVITRWLSVVVVAHAVDEDHQHGPGHEEQGHGRKGIDEHPEPLSHVLAVGIQSRNDCTGSRASSCEEGSADEYDH